VALALKKDVHFKIDEKKRKVEFFPERVEKEVHIPLELKTMGKGKWEHYVEHSLRAIHLLKRDRDYILQE